MKWNGNEFCSIYKSNFNQFAMASRAIDFEMREKWENTLSFMVSNWFSILSLLGEISKLKIDFWEHILTHFSKKIFRCWLNCYESKFVCWFIVLFCWDKKAFFSLLLSIVSIRAANYVEIEGRNEEDGGEITTKLISNVETVQR